MTDRNDEQIAADNALDEAIRRVSSTREIIEEDEVVVGWIVVVAAQGMDDETSSYGMLSPSGNQPHHVALGLIEAGRQHLDSNFRAADDR